VLLLCAAAALEVRQTSTLIMGGPLEAMLVVAEAEGALLPVLVFPLLLELLTLAAVVVRAKMVVLELLFCALLAHRQRFLLV